MCKITLAFLAGTSTGLGATEKCLFLTVIAIIVEQINQYISKLISCFRYSSNLVKIKLNELISFTFNNNVWLEIS